MIDVLIIDDIHELAGKTKTQDSFFNIFNHLHQNKKQIVLTVDRPPAELRGLEARLLSRFKWGLSAEITSPEYDTRMQILKRKMYRDGLTIPNEVVEYLANNVNTTIRELEGALVSVLAIATLLKRPIDITVAQESVRKLIRYEQKEVSVNKIIKVVTEHFNIEPDDMHSRSRKRDIATARQIAMYFAKKHTKLPLSAIGAQIGKRDHATVLHAEKAIKNLFETDKDMRCNIQEMEKKLLA
jgi:chromosomal replication initiator protein